MKKIVSIIVLFALYCNCINNKDEDTTVCFTYKDFGNSIELKGEVLPSDSLWKPGNLYFVDSSFVFIDDYYGDYFVLTYNKNLQLITKNVPKGNGPNESVNCRILQTGSTYIWAFDMALRQMKAYNKNDLLTKNNIPPEKTTSFNEQFFRIAAISNNSFVGASISDHDNLLSLYDHNGMKNNTINAPYPQFMAKENNLENNRLFENRIYYSEKNNKIVVLYIHTDLIDIYDENLNLLKRIHGPDQFIPELSFNNNSAQIIPNKTKFAYAQARFTSTEIWALYYGTSPDFTGIEGPNRIFVFDFTGKPLRSYTLEFPVRGGFDVDEDNNVLYCLSEITEVSVVKYKF